MKILVFLLFLPFYSFSQNFMMKMDVTETRIDTVIYHCGVKVIWGIKNEEICFLWGEYYPLCFTKVKPVIIHSKKVREAVDRFIEEQIEQVDEKNIKLVNTFRNKWGELFIIIISMRTDTIIFINRVDDIYPYYSFISTN